MPAAIPSVIKCGSKLTLEHELELIGPELSHNETEETWDAIFRALSRLSAVCRGGGCEFPRELVAFLRDFSRPVISALNSERSRLSGAAADMIGVVASGLGRLFEALLPLFLPALLTLCTRPNKLFINRARSCILLVIEHTQLPSIISFLLCSLKDKSVSLRLVAIDCIFACLNSCGPQDLQKETRAKEIEAAIKSTATDSHADVRKASRRVFETYKVLFEYRVESFVSPMTPTMKKYLDIKSMPSSKPQSRPPSRPQSALSAHSRGGDAHLSKAPPKPEKSSEQPAQVTHSRSASESQAAVVRNTEPAASRPASRTRSQKHVPQGPDPLANHGVKQGRAARAMHPTEQIALRPAQRPTSLSVRSQEGAVAGPSDAIHKPGQSTSSAAAAPPTGLVRRPAQPGSNTTSTSAPLRPPMGQRAGTVEGSKDGARRPLNTATEPEAKAELKDAAHPTKGPKRVPLLQLETSKPNASDSKVSRKPTPKDAHPQVGKDIKVDVKSRLLKSVPSNPVLAKTKSSDSAPTGPQPRLRHQKSVLSRSANGTIIDRQQSALPRAAKEADHIQTGTATPTAQTVQEMKETKKGTSKEATKPESSQPASRAVRAKSSKVKKIETRKAGGTPAATSPPEQETLVDDIPLPSSREATPTPSLVPLPASPITPDAQLPPVDAILAAAEAQHAEDAGPTEKHIPGEREETRDLADVRTPVARPVSAHAALVHGPDEMATPFKTPISKLVSQIERGLIWTPGSLEDDSVLYDESFDLDLTPVPALVIRRNGFTAAGDDSF
ncbi:hypothetical protein OE88DRAFT_1655035 [Heliocybe sulcata]|uniref:TOG domain-containing protein n=1 Tax=Heliocybe sulcata TaxID=5364 RepID=A0A5C3NAT0_9AGAM|nr:hypothetical protein OE88DRAFT_1655035 [Heliocybe sulcata]